jgi:hypothetical protein
LVLLFGPCFVDLLRDGVGKDLLVSPDPLDLLAVVTAVAKARFFPMRFKRVGLCDFLRVEGFMCENALGRPVAIVAGDRRGTVRSTWTKTHD